MNHFFTYTLFFLFLGQIYAQQNTKGEKSTFESEYTRNYRLPDGAFVVEVKRGKGDLEGTPYLNNEFLPATINETEHVKARYNAYKDIFECQIGEDYYFLNPYVNKTIVKFESSNQLYYFLEYKNGKDVQSGFLAQIFNSNQLKLYKKESIEFKLGVAPVTSYDLQIPDKFRKKKDEFYIQIDGNQIENLPTNKNKFAKLFGDNQKLVAAYLKENNINLSEENSLIKTFQYLNSNLK